MTSTAARPGTPGRALSVPPFVTARAARRLRGDSVFRGLLRGAALVLIGLVVAMLGRTLGFLPLFQGPPYGVGMLAAGMILAIMVVPFITAVSREVLVAVPNTQREAALALGATRWETTRMAVLRYGKSGLIGAIL